jgi:hypothetical protein
LRNPLIPIRGSSGCCEKTSAIELDNGQTVYVMRMVPPSEMSSTGVPAGIGTMLMNLPPDQPWLSGNPRDMTSMYAMMLRAGAQAKTEMAAEANTGADNLGFNQSSGTQQVSCDSMRMLVDADEYVPLLFKMNCTVTEGRETRQMASMPASQRQMMESMMGPQLEMMRSIASGGVAAVDAAPSGLAKSDLTADYLQGDWCTDVVQERSLYTFDADGSYRVGVVGITITQVDGINYLPEVHSRQGFLDEFQSVRSRSQDRFSVIRKGGLELAFARGNCFK